MFAQTLVPLGLAHWPRVARRRTQSEVARFFACSVTCANNGANLFAQLIVPLGLAHCATQLDEETGQSQIQGFARFLRGVRFGDSLLARLGDRLADLSENRGGAFVQLNGA